MISWYLSQKECMYLFCFVIDVICVLILNYDLRRQKTTRIYSKPLNKKYIGSGVRFKIISRKPGGNQLKIRQICWYPVS